ncbi:MAG: hypothetical protein ACLT0Y_06200 [Christensenellales bacterium]
MKRLRLLPRLLFTTLLVVLVASLMTALIYASVGPKTFANERVKGATQRGGGFSYYLQYQSEEMTLRNLSALTCRDYGQPDAGV